MTYAISTPIVRHLVSGATGVSDLVNRLIAIFLGAGWKSAGALAGGATLLGTSPQGYSVYCDIWNNPTGGIFGERTASVRLRSAVGSGAVGFSHALHFDTVDFDVIAHPCGFSICRPGVASFNYGSSIIGGIPFVGTNCGVVGSPVTEAWFSFGDFNNNPFASADNPRLGIDIGNRQNGNQTGCFNGVMASMGGGSNWSVPEILRLSSAAPDGTYGDSHPLRYGEADILYPALVAWPDAEGTPLKQRGQIYNAAARSGMSAMDAVRTWDGYQWVNYTASYFWGSLWLAQSVGSGPGNIAY